ncbi:MAG: hypothetical protein ACYC99_11025 [Candidatus Geothermincolia bacterium]
MKRIAPVALVIVVLIALTAFAGCGEGGDATEARKLIESGNAQIKEIEPEFLEIVDLSEKLFSGYSHRVETDSAVAEDVMKGFLDRFNRLLEQVRRIKVPFSRVISMDGVETYKDYASLKLKSLGKIEAAGAVLAKTFPIIVNSIETGESPDANALEGAKRELIGLEMEISFFDVEADQLAEEKGLLK